MNTDMRHLGSLISLACFLAVSSAEATTLPTGLPGPWRALAGGASFALLSCEHGDFASEAGSDCETLGAWGELWPADLVLRGPSLSQSPGSSAPCHLLLGTSRRDGGSSHTIGGTDFVMLVAPGSGDAVTAYLDAAWAAHRSGMADATRSREFWRAMLAAASSSDPTVAELLRTDLTSHLSPWLQPEEDLGRWVNLLSEKPIDATGPQQRRGMVWRVVFGRTIAEPTEANQMALARLVEVDEEHAANLLRDFSPRRIPWGGPFEEAVRHMVTHGDVPERRAIAARAVEIMEAHQSAHPGR